MRPPNRCARNAINPAASEVLSPSRRRQVLLNPDVMARLLATPVSPPKTSGPLSDREREVLELVSQRYRCQPRTFQYRSEATNRTASSVVAV